MKRRSAASAADFEGVLLTLGSIAVSLLFVIPLLWVVSGSLRPPGLPPPRSLEWLPANPAWGNYARLFELLPFGRYLVNSLTVSTLAVPITLVTASWAGFAMAGLEHRQRNALALFSVGLLMVPVTALWLTRYVLFRWLGLLDSYAALLAPALMGSSPLFVLLFYWTFRRIPEELFASAEVDGAGTWAQWRLLAMPMAGPTTVAVGILTFILYWSDFINPLLYLKSEALYTLPVGLQQLQQLDRTNWPLLMAACVIFTGPTVLFFLVVQRYFLQESPLSGLKE